MSVSVKYETNQRTTGRKGPLDILSNLFRRLKDVGVTEDDDHDDDSDRSQDGSSGVMCKGGMICSDPLDASPRHVCLGYSPATTSCCDETDQLSSVDLFLCPPQTADSLSVTSPCPSPEPWSPGSSTHGMNVRYSRVHRVHNFDYEVEEALRLSRHDNPVVQKKLASCMNFLDSSSEEGGLGLSPGSRQSCCEASGDCSMTPPAILQPSPRDNYLPLNDIQQHLVRSPPPCIATLRSFTYDSDGYRSGDGDGNESCDRCSLPGDDDDDVFSSGLRQVQNVPLPHVKQSCPMFRPLATVQKCIFQESRLYRDHKKQPKDLKPLLSRSSNDVIDLRTRMFEVHQRQREMIAGNQTNLCSSVPASPLLLAATRRKRHLSTPARPLTYPSQKTL